MTELPVGTVTFLLADVEGSTQLWEEGAEAMSASMERLNALTDEIVTRHSGARPVEQGEGDSFVAGFARASAAVACALELQHTFLAESWPGPTLAVRVGLHTGEARLRDDGKNYAGEAMNRCARLRNLGHGGQTLISRSTHELVVESLPTDASLRDLGPHRLRDLQRPEHVWQLTHPDLRDDFLPLRSLEAMPNNLPAQLTSFIGREAEIAELRALLRDNRMVTLIGAGGVGKTRLAVEMAADLLDDYPDGVWWVDLSSVNKPELVPNSVALAAGIREVSTRPMTDVLVMELENQDVLVLLDNCEHLLDACAELAEQVLLKCSRLSLVATSREPLGVPGEVAWRVPSLGLPEDDGEEVAKVEAVRLFRDRARATRPNFRITDDNAKAVADICRQVEGIPLAIELAAARVRVLTVQQIAAGLADSFHLLRGGPRALPRQRTLEASVDWSHNLLSEEERVLLRRLSVFTGGFTLDAAEGVCAGDAVEAYSVLGLLSALVDKSLVEMDDDGEDARYAILETIRQYAAQRLADAGEGQSIGDNHLAFYLELAERAAPDQINIELDELDDEYDNLRSAHDWAIRTAKTDVALRLGVALSLFWFVRGYYTEARGRLDACLETIGGDTLSRSAAERWASWFAFATYDHPAGVRHGERAVALARETDDAILLSHALGVLSQSLMFLDLPRSRATSDEAILLARETGDPVCLYTANCSIGLIELISGNLVAARHAIEDALHVDYEGRSLPERSFALYALGNIDWLTGDFRRAESVFVEALERSREGGVHVITCWSLGQLSSLAAARGEFAPSSTLLEEAERVSNKLGIPDLDTPSARGLNRAARRDFVGALADVEEALRLAAALGVAWFEGLILPIAAILAAAAGNTEAARTYLDKALDTTRDRPLLWGQAVAQFGEGLLARQADDDERAEVLHQEALAASMEGDAKGIAVLSLEALAGLAARAGRAEDASRLFGVADAVRAELGMTWRGHPLGGDPDEYAADVAIARDALGDEAFEKAFAEGGSMTLQEAVAYVQRGRGERKRPSFGWDSLTPAECDVVRLVAEGLSNKEIAGKLFVSPRTVQTHLTHVYSKLPITSRVQLAQEAGRRSSGTVPPSS